MQYLDQIKDDILELGALSVREVVDHLEQQCLALTNMEKEAKLEETRLPWDLNDDITTYFAKLDKIEDELDELDIEWPTSIKITQAVNQMYASNQFEKREYREWEKKPREEKTWVHCQAFFTGLFNDNKRFGDAAGNKHGFESAANADERQKDNTTININAEIVNNIREVAIAATADKEHIQQMTSTNEDLLKIVKEQQNQISQLIKQNGELTSAMGTKNTTTNNNNNGNSNSSGSNSNSNNQNNNRNNNRNRNNNKNNERNSGDKKTNYGCTICGKHSKTEECLELEQNKGKRKENWKSIFD